MTKYGDTHKYPEYRTIYTVNRADGTVVLAYQSEKKAYQVAEELREILKRHHFVMTLRYEVEDV